MNSIFITPYEMRLLFDFQAYFYLIKGRARSCNDCGLVHMGPFCLFYFIYLFNFLGLDMCYSLLRMNMPYAYNDFAELWLF